jgi:hypothetical protein
MRGDYARNSACNSTSQFSFLAFHVRNGRKYPAVLASFLSWLFMCEFTDLPESWQWDSSDFLKFSPSLMISSQPFHTVCYFLLIYLVFSNVVNLAHTIQQAGKIVGVKKGRYSQIPGGSRVSMAIAYLSTISNRVQKRDADSGKDGENFLRLLLEKPGELG